ncbi:hypothetical protein GCM10010236_75870 [Streptomyces eurythermus]|nr:hypothetical protein GCM10010236_75870 [Streptomyces eurythermus]
MRVARVVELRPDEAALSGGQCPSDLFQQAPQKVDPRIPFLGRPADPFVAEPAPQEQQDRGVRTAFARVPMGEFMGE